jgi:hypothetical protein
MPSASKIYFFLFFYGEEIIKREDMAALNISQDFFYIAAK